jgi:hypothetical protein
MPSDGLERVALGHPYPCLADFIGKGLAWLEIISTHDPIPAVSQRGDWKG